jgi:hypothetical protein
LNAGLNIFKNYWHFQVSIFQSNQCKQCRWNIQRSLAKLLYKKHTCYCEERMLWMYSSNRLLHLSTENIPRDMCNICQQTNMNHLCIVGKLLLMLESRVLRILHSWARFRNSSSIALKINWKFTWWIAQEKWAIDITACTYSLAQASNAIWNVFRTGSAVDCPRKNAKIQ